jgi:hypothetical protein
MILRKIKLDEKQKHSGITTGDWMRDIQKHHLLVDAKPLPKVIG